MPIMPQREQKSAQDVTETNETEAAPTTENE
jgi:hypothetical protein